MRLVFSMFFATMALLALNGCSGKSLGIGYNETYCEQRGCDFQDAGVCGDPMEIYKYRKYIDATGAAYRKKENR